MVKVAYKAKFDHLRVLRFKGFTLTDGEETSLPDDVAGHLLATHPEGVTVVSGTPAAYTPRSPKVKAEIAAFVAREDAFPSDPSAALAAVPVLPKGLIGLKADDIAAGKADTHLGALAVYHRLGGKEDLATACVERGIAIAKGE